MFSHQRGYYISIKYGTKSRTSCLKGEKTLTNQANNNDTAYYNKKILCNCCCLIICTEQAYSLRYQDACMIVIPMFSYTVLKPQM